MSQSTNQIPLTPLDQESFSGPIQMLKAFVPYLDPSSAQKLAMLARIFEMKSTMNIFNEKQLSICSFSGSSKPTIEDILKDIRKYCAPQEAEQIDQFLHMLNAVRLYNQYNDLFKNSDLASMMGQMNTMNMSSSHKSNGMNITPDQLQMIQNFLHAQSASGSKDSI